MSLVFKTVILHAVRYKAAIPAITGLLIAGYTAYNLIDVPGKPPYELAVVKRGDLVHKVLAAGTVNAVVTVQVGSQTSGTIKAIYADYNTPVKKGQLLALIDPDAFSAQLMQARANLVSAQANLARQEAIILYSKALLEREDVQLKEAWINLKRTRELFRKGFVSRSELDAAEAAHGTASARKKAQDAHLQAELKALGAAQAQVAQNAGAVELAEVNFDRTKIRSPIDGVVISRAIDVGQTVAASFQSPTLFVIAKDLTRMEVNARVSEADIGGVQVGQDVIFTVDAYPGKAFGCKVKEIRMSPSAGQAPVTYGVLAQLDNKGLLLRPGMTTDVWITTQSKENALLLPVTALREKGREKYVEVLEGKKTVWKNVRTGLKGEGGVIEILSGLAEGEKVIIPGKKK